MPATPARIGFVMTDVRRAIAETGTAAARHGDLARRDDQPVESFFDSVADAQAVATARQLLLSPERRRFAVVTPGLDAALQLQMAGPSLPVGSWNEPESGLALDVVVATAAFDFAAQKATIEVWG